MGWDGIAYVDVETQDRVFTPCALEAGDFGDELVVWALTCSWT